MPQNININVNEVINFIVLSVIVKVIADDWIMGILKWIGRILKRLLIRIFIRTEGDLIVFLHSFHKAAKEGHHYETIVKCPDGDCKKVTKSL